MRCKALQHNYILLLFDNHKSDHSQSPLDSALGDQGGRRDFPTKCQGLMHGAISQLMRDWGKLEPWGVNDFIRIGGYFICGFTHTLTHTSTILAVERSFLLGAGGGDWQVHWSLLHLQDEVIFMHPLRVGALHLQGTLENTISRHQKARGAGAWWLAC